MSDPSGQVSVAGAAFAKRVVDSVPSMLAYWDRGLICRFANRAYELWFGADPDALVGTHLADLLGPELYASNQPHLDGVLRGEAQMFERLIRGPDGVERASLAHYMPDVVDGEVVGFVVQVTEVTRLKQTEEALRAEVSERTRAYDLLRRSEAALREAQRLGQTGSWQWDLRPDTQTWSDELYAIFGCDPTQPAPNGQDHANLYTPESWDALRRAVVRAIKTGEPYALELQYRRPDGATRWMEGRGEAVRDDSGTIVALRGVALEITTRRQMVEASMQRDLAEAASLNKTQFLSRVSHELRTPLNAVLGFAQLCAMDDSLDDKHRQWARVIMSSGQHMLDLVEDILDLSGAEMGQLKVAQVRVDLRPLLVASLAELQPLAEQAGVRLIDALAVEPCLAVTADVRRVRQVVNNLLSNAIKYNRAGGQVRISIARRGGWVDLAVEDTGIGMSAAQRERLFTPFDRLGVETTGVPGRGIGLALTRKLIEMMGGEIGVDSEAGVGTTFRVSLPIAEG